MNRDVQKLSSTDAEQWPLGPGEGLLTKGERPVRERRLRTGLPYSTPGCLALRGLSLRGRFQRVSSSCSPFRFNLSVWFDATVKSLLKSSLAVVIVVASLLSTGCASEKPAGSSPSPIESSPTAAPANAAAPTTAEKGERDVKAALRLKKADDMYRQRLIEGHTYKTTAKMDYFDAWWSYMTVGLTGSGKLIDSAQVAYSDAMDFYGQDATPGALDDWDTLMDARGEFDIHTSLWHSTGNDAEYQASLIVLDRADRLADQIAPGAVYKPTPLPPLVPSP